MNEIKSGEGNKHLIHAVTSQSNPFSPGFISEDELKRWHSSESHLMDLNSFRLSTFGAHSTQSQFSPLKRSVGQSGCCSTQNGLKLKNCETLESQCNKVQSRLFDLECPVEGDRGVSALSGSENYHLKRNYEVPRGSDGNSSMHYNSNCRSNGEATGFNLNLKRTCGFTDLNEPILVERASTSPCVGIPGNITCSNEDVQKNNLSLLSHSDLVSTNVLQNFARNPIKQEREGVILTICIWRLKGGQMDGSLINLKMVM